LEHIHVNKKHVQFTSTHLGHGALSGSLFHKSNVGTLRLFVEVVGNSGKSNRACSEKTSKDLGGGARVGALGLTRCLQRLDQVTSISVGVVGGSRGELLFALGRLFVETLTNFKDFILILVVAVVLFVGIDGLLTGDAVVFDEGGG